MNRNVQHLESKSRSSAEGGWYWDETAALLRDEIRVLEKKNKKA